MEENNVKPWDILNPNTEYATKNIADQRYSICQSCPELIKLTKQCKQCGCFMVIKTKLQQAKCPIGKW
jgi:RNA polymerase-binding transcription factor DksA